MIDVDPRAVRMKGVAFHGNTPFDVPYISQITESLYMGGCADGLALPDDIVNVVALYQEERYFLHRGVRAFHEIRMQDVVGAIDHAGVQSVARLVLDLIETGPTLVHCQAGLNRSGLVCATALVISGVPPDDAIELLRAKRSPAVLCNPSFEEYVRGLSW